jgi:DNA adenine methylase
MGNGGESGSKPASSSERVKPFLKWVGGKSQLLQRLKAAAPSCYRTYHEPFLGGGALFFALRPKRAILSDINPELICAYKAVRDNLSGLIESLEKHVYDKDYYYRIRELDRTPEYEQLSSVEKAARLIYLNKTCYNGLYRVNSKGHFNVPIGAYKNPTICDVETLLGCSRALADAELSCSPFRDVLSRAEQGDFIYFDPPYVPLSSTSNFTSYSNEGFDAEAQAELAFVCSELNKRGVQFMLSNSNTDSVREMYGKFHLDSVSAVRAVNSQADGRGAVEELIISNYR